MPRITNVAYEMAWLPLGLVEDSATTRLIFSVIFNIIAMGFMIRPSTIISTVGEVMTPALLVLLLVVGITVFVSPLSDIVAPSQTYAENSALTTGLISGYQTMVCTGCDCLWWNCCTGVVCKKCDQSTKDCSIYDFSGFCICHFISLSIFCFILLRGDF